MYNDDFRDFDIELEIIDDPNYIYYLETYDLPYGCRYRQMIPLLPQQGGFRSPQGGPPFGPPQGGPPPFGSPQGGPPQGGGQQGAPTSPPPNFTPAKQTTFQAQGGGVAKFVEPGTIRPCVFRYVYIWPRRGRGFWAWLVFVGRRSVSGYRWDGRRWIYFGMDLRNIESFQCF